MYASNICPTVFNENTLFVFLTLEAPLKIVKVYFQDREQSTQFVDWSQCSPEFTLISFNAIKNVFRSLIILFMAHFCKFKHMILWGKQKRNKMYFVSQRGSCTQVIEGAMSKGKEMSTGKGHIFNYFQRVLVYVL